MRLERDETVFRYMNRQTKAKYESDNIQESKSIKIRQTASSFEYQRV